MSRPRNWWYGTVRGVIARYPSIKNDGSMQSAIYSFAIEKALAETEALPEGGVRAAAVRSVCIDRTLTVDGAALRFYYSPRTVQRWVNHFVKTVGKHAGFSQQP